MVNVKLSVIIPIYNAEKYLKKCIESVLNQSFRDFELILVDDGSKDSSGSICDVYAKGDGRIKVIHKTNGGSVSARKEGLLIAKGEYVSYVDSDDWLDANMYEAMFNRADDADVIICGYISETQYGSSKEKHNIPSGIYEEERMQKLREHLLFTGTFYEAGIVPALWNKLFKRSLITNVMEIAPFDIKMGEDAIVTYPALLDASKIVIMNEFAPYHYRVMPNTLSTSFDEFYFDRIEILNKFLRKELSDRNEDIAKSQLPYYLMFLIHIGIISELSLRNKKSLVRKFNSLNKIVKSKWLKEAVKGVKRERVPEDIWELKYAIDSTHFNRWIVKYYLVKIWDKLKKLVRIK
ncbi:MAG: glycosyltransferase [Phascolarctobacterium sp.]|uniref:glycosyltransferase family 2 protein n=1 Tax=Phascolarctobacterium sp. TaxID=2049039 RepID=UPI0025D6F6D3|nr:glycosyltransferase family 2 protein [Phascolarctobacterium sp.]MCC8158710.1 glycosyltransferase [Phascolarctobacterium sp.]